MYLIFDTETTGLPRNWNAPLTDFDNWPRLVQLAWQIHDKSGQLIEVKNFIVRPEGFTIPYNAEKVHGISTQMAIDKGNELHFVLSEFDKALAQSTYCVGHNIEFDLNIVGCEYLRDNQTNPLQTALSIDTKNESTEFCAIPGGRGGQYKWPSLTELHAKLFGVEFDAAHNAAADVEASTRCFLELIRLGVIQDKTIAFTGEDRSNYLQNNPSTIEAIGINIKPFQASDSPSPIEEKATTEIPATPAITEPKADLKHSTFVHLHGHSQYSVLQSTASIKGIIEKAKKYEMPAVAITDLGNMYGTFQFVKLASKSNIKAIVGCEFNVCNDHLNKEFKDNGNQIVLLAKNKNGYRNLSKLCSISHLDGFYYVPRIDKNLLLQYKEDLIALSGGLRGEVADLILNTGHTHAETAADWWKETFKDDFYIELVNHGLEEEKRLLEDLVGLAKSKKIKTIASNNYFYLDQSDSNAHDILLCVKDGEKQSTPIGRGRGFRYGFANDQYYFKSPEEMIQLFSSHPEAIENITEVLNKIESYGLESDVLLPKFDIPSDMNSEEEYLRYLTYEGAKKRYNEITPEIKERLDFELEVINKTGYPGYFLIVQDFTRKAREMNVAVGPGRGSAAGSAVAYCTGITNVDPIKYDLLFERFLNPDRVSLPDIDIDFDDNGRGKIIDYVIAKYGKNQVAQIITYGKMAAKSAIRDAGRVLDLPLSVTDRIAKLIPDTPGTTLAKAMKQVPELVALKAEDSLEGRTIKQAEIIEGSVRNTGIHACGVIITPGDISNFVPICSSKDSDLLVTQYDNNVVESAGLLKMDFLGLKTLSIIKDAIEIIKARKGIDIDPDDIPLDDEKTYQLYQKGETNGTFQFESPGMQKHLRALKPDKFGDLIAMNALYRPGPIEYIPNFIARKHGKEEISYDLAEMEGHLKETYGITVYQEQVMLLSQKLAGFTKGEADILRKAMGKKIKALLDELKPKFIEGCKSNGHDEKIAQKIWSDWEAFAEYAFNKSHSTCYSIVAFQTAYLKANYPEEFMASVLTNNMNDIKKVTFFMEECKRMGINVLGPDINESYFKFAVNKEGQIRFGLGAIKGVGAAAVESIIEERKQNGTFPNVFEVLKRIDLKSANKKTFESLVVAGAFDSFGTIHRSQYFAITEGETTYLEKLIKFGNAIQQNDDNGQNSLFGDQMQVEISTPQPPMALPWENLERLNREKEVVGVFISGHPLDDYNLEFKNFCTHSVDSLNDISALKGQEICFAGIVSDASHRTTKTGKPFGTLTIEDYSDSITLFLFGEDYIQFKNHLNKNWFLFIKAKVIPRKWKEDELEIKIHHIELLQELRQKKTKKLSIQIHTDQLTESFTQELIHLIENENKERNADTKPLEVIILSPEENIQLKLQSRSKQVSLRNDFFNKLTALKIPFELSVD